MLHSPLPPSPRRCDTEKSLLFVFTCCGGADIPLHRNCEQSRKRKLRELYAYTALLNTARPLLTRDWAIPDEPQPDEAFFLDQSDISK